MKQQNWKKSMTAIVMAGVLGVSVAAGAAAVRQKISAELRPDITLKVNGQVQELEKEAISYQGSTYLPVRAVGEAMGMEVDWDSKTQTVSLNGSWKDDDGADVQNGAIGMEKAKSIALKDAGFDREEVFFVKTRSDWNNGQLVYEVDFVKGSTKYEYEIRAKDGVILDRDRETWTENGSYIGLEKAKSIALKDAGFTAGQVTFLKAEQDWNDGRMKYEVEFVKGGTEYEYDIDAQSGAILRKDKEVWAQDDDDDQDDDRPQSGSEIGLEKAKSIALKDAGFTSGQVTITKAGRDWDDGRLEYEVEFVKNGAEYEYTIDARTGSILEKDVDRD